MFFKLLGLFRGIDKKIALTIINIIRLIVQSIRDKNIDNKNAKQVFIDIVDQLPVDPKFSIFVKNFAQYYFDDYNIDISEAVKLADTLFRLNNIGIMLNENPENWVLTIKK